MSHAILVTYATHFGTAKEAAEVIARTLRQCEFDVHCRPMTAVNGLDAYDAVVLGSAVDGDAWLPDAARFIARHTPVLKRMPVALFSVQVQNASAGERPAPLVCLDQVRAQLRPVAERFFTACFDRRGAAILVPGMPAWVTPRIDQSDCDKIRVWAHDLPLRFFPREEPAGIAA